MLSYTTWTNDTMQVFTGGANETDPSTASKALPRDKLETNDMFYQIFMFYGRNTQLTRGAIGFEEAFTQFGLDVEGIGNPVGSLSGSETSKSMDTASIWTTQATGLLRNKDGTAYGLKYKNVRGFGLPVQKRDSMLKSSADSTNYWKKKYEKSQR
ncbi:hypothetical protein MKS83_17445 [Chryseobacterium sp. Y16C]|uniref:hypothetical protein n=1 Tax=Chryseobacterium sp. Y16C TaxID=2920939 RepID=UPI001F0B6F21|nr:hypothetical protein [Chryseobacterium sp. Y16C]UMQ41174.1 hypothetical protein MKS83_17445 [Chryseobacterium sp. Y16C]